MSLYGTERRERGYGGKQKCTNCKHTAKSSSQLNPKKNWLGPQICDAVRGTYSICGSPTNATVQEENTNLNARNHVIKLQILFRRWMKLNTKRIKTVQVYLIF
jgi:hypothetical protein